MTHAPSSEDVFEGETADPHLLALRAYVWGLPLVGAAKLRLHFTSPQDPFAPRLPTSAGAALNNIGHQRRLSDPSLAGVAPNVDTLYSLAWLDLAGEPLVLETPDFGSRYYTFQMGYGDTATELSLGARTHGGRLPSVFVSGPSHSGTPPPGMLHVPCHTRYFLLAGRTLVRPDDPSDFEAVHALQSRLRLRTLTRHLAGLSGPNPVPRQRPLDGSADSVGADLGALTELGSVLRDWIVSPHERLLVESFSRIGVTPGHGFRAEELSGAAKAAVGRGIAAGAEIVERKTRSLGRNVNGWTINYLGARFGDDYLLRAAVATDQIYATVPEEALYAVAKDSSDGQPFSGGQAYVLRFAAGDLPPVDAFWSLTMYTRDGPPLVPNPIDRYAIGDRTAGLVTDSDGSLAIRIQHEAPASETTANWLPAPRGAFHLMLRLYGPRPSVLDGSWTPPPVERVSTP